MFLSYSNAACSIYTWDSFALSQASGLLETTWGVPPGLDGSHGPHGPAAHECQFTCFLKELDLHGCNEAGLTGAEFERRQLELSALIEAVTQSAQPLEWSCPRLIPTLRGWSKEAAQVCWRSEPSATHTPSERQPGCALGATHPKTNAIWPLECLETTNEVGCLNQEPAGCQGGMSMWPAHTRKVETEHPNAADERKHPCQK